MVTNNCVEQWACHTIAAVDQHFWLLETDMVNRKYRVLWFDARSYVFFEHSLYFHHRLLRGLSGLFLGLPTPPKYWNRNYPYEISVNNTLPLNLLRDHLWFSSRFCIFFKLFIITIWTKHFGFAVSDIKIVIFWWSFNFNLCSFQFCFVACWNIVANWL